MAVAVDGVYGSYAPSSSIATTVASNADRCLYIYLCTGSDPTGVARDGQSFTQIKAFDAYTSLWRLVAPNTGTSNIVVTGGDSVYSAEVFSLYGVDQTTPERGTPTYTHDVSNTSSSVTATLTTVAGDMCCDGGVHGGGNPSLTIGAGQTLVDNGSDGDYRYVGSYEAASGTSTVMSWSNGATLADWSQIAWVVRSASGSSATPYRAWMRRKSVS